ncbi:MAG: hypothetical protein ACJ752_00560 [Gaiellaceae bacterium]
MATQPHYLETRLWLGNALERTADWRSDKETEFPDDPRNGRAAVALRTAAYYVRGANESAGVARFAELVRDSLGSGIDLLITGEAGFTHPEAERIAARYFFDRFATMPNEADHEQLLVDLYDATLRDLADYDDVAEGAPLSDRIAAQVRSDSSQDLDIGRLAQLIERLARDEQGVTITPIRKGMHRGGFGSDAVYPNDGWEIGTVNAVGGSELTVGPSIAVAVEQALFELGDER